MTAFPCRESASARLASCTLVTGNRDKLAEARRICGIEIEHAAIDLPEIQSGVLTEVAQEKAREAWRRLERPVIIDETALELSALNGFPGPLIKFMLDAVGPDGVARTAAALGDVGVSAVCLLIYFDGSEMTSAEGRAHGHLVCPPRGEHGFGFDTVFRPEGETLTYAELGDKRKDAIGHRGRAWRALLGKLGELETRHRPGSK